MMIKRVLLVIICLVNIIECNNYDSINNQWNGIYAILSDINKIYCNRQDIGKWKNGIDNVKIQCPDIDIVCIGPKPLKCTRGHWSEIYNKCLCHVGYIGADCSIQDREITPNLVAAQRGLLYVCSNTQFP